MYERISSMAEEQDIVLSVPDMSCVHCVNTINSSLQTLSGVENVQVSLPTKTVHLRYHSSQVSLQQIESVLMMQAIPWQSRSSLGNLVRFQLLAQAALA